MTTDKFPIMRRLTDAEFVAEVAARALTEGRYELGRALANLTAQAARSEAQTAHALGVAAVPAQNTDNACPDEHQPPHAYGSHPDHCGTCSLASKAVLADDEQAPESTMAIPPAARCSATVRSGDLTRFCDQPVYWAKVDGVESWYHIDASLHADHAAIVNENR